MNSAGRSAFSLKILVVTWGTPRKFSAQSTTAATDLFQQHSTILTGSVCSSLTMGIGASHGEHKRRRINHECLAFPPMMVEVLQIIYAKNMQNEVHPPFGARMASTMVDGPKDEIQLQFDDRCFTYGPL